MRKILRNKDLGAPVRRCGAEAGRFRIRSACRGTLTIVSFLYPRSRLFVTRKRFLGAGLWKREVGLDGIDDGIELAIPGAALL